LVPKKALEMAADFFLQLEDFSPSQVLENRLQSALSGTPPEDPTGESKSAHLAKPFLDAVAAPTATPGGGSVSAFAGALAGALGQMVASLSRKKKSQAAHVVQLSDMLDRLRRTTDDLTKAIDRDAEAFDAVMEAFKLPQGEANENAARDKAIQVATRGAAEAPLQAADVTVALFEQLVQLEAIAAASMRSDLQVARFMAAAGARGSLANAEINLDSLHDAAYVSKVKLKAASLRERLEQNPAI
jgi:glutamate formiminotransferase/formiminotetrahydrofolate cyclodeaminase